MRSKTDSGFLEIFFCLDYLKCFKHRFHFRLVRGKPFSGGNDKRAEDLRVTRVASGNDNSNTVCSGLTRCWSIGIHNQVKDFPAFLQSMQSPLLVGFASPNMLPEVSKCVHLSASMGEEVLAVWKDWYFRRLTPIPLRIWFASWVFCALTG